MSLRRRRGFVRSAPSKVDKSQRVDLRVTDMRAADAVWWDQRLGPKHARIRSRADRHWSWTALLPMCHLVQLARRRYCRALVIWARADNRRFVRAGMSILIERYPHLDIAHPGESNFIWFLSAADSQVLSRDYGVSQPPALARVLLDNAIVLSQMSGLEGRIGLHAARAGGRGLLAVYRKCGLLRLELGVRLPPGVRRRNDGRYFYADEAVAEQLAAALDGARTAGK
jgi:hypothetical protein